MLQFVSAQNELVCLWTAKLQNTHWVTPIRFVQCITSIPLSHTCITIMYCLNCAIWGTPSIFDKSRLSRQVVQGTADIQRRKGLNLLVMLHALNTGYQDVAVPSVSMRFPWLYRLPVTNFRPNYVTLPTRSSSEIQLCIGFFAIV